MKKKLLCIAVSVLALLSTSGCGVVEVIDYSEAREIYDAYGSKSDVFTKYSNDKLYRTLSCVITHKQTVDGVDVQNIEKYEIDRNDSNYYIYFYKTTTAGKSEVLYFYDESLATPSYRFLSTDNQNNNSNDSNDETDPTLVNETQVKAYLAGVLNVLRYYSCVHYFPESQNPEGHSYNFVKQDDKLLFKDSKSSSHNELQYLSYNGDGLLIEGLFDFSSLDSTYPYPADYSTKCEITYNARLKDKLTSL
jgi:hypothetical protein